MISLFSSYHKELTTNILLTGTIFYFRYIILNFQNIKIYRTIIKYLIYKYTNEVFKY